MSDAFPYQVSGPIATAFKEAVYKSFEDIDFVVNYLTGIRIQTAEELHLESIGMLVGFLRPLVPSSFSLATPFLLSNDTLTPVSPSTGFGDSLTPSLASGLLASSTLSTDSKISLLWFRRLLVETAKIKYQGISLSVVDGICHTLTDTYTITLETNGDISVVFPVEFSRQYTYILQRIFSKLCTSPQVFISKEV